ncbi:ABC transporter ATP-binding protein [Mycetocola tolaasinivorans]|uniref:ABC transporter ATP-binding protein n=1 Tax=Mycetocola tolaasinivorans TaxID=76635 RepID=A0A3L7A7C8_9MICO|nr:ABC transporter ATP-binding protein [Mycetocola tolaasinivorans]RLP76077.1 ABC transporter ATP-binding protein [Mycetocola tolaasinivorans]
MSSETTPAREPVLDITDLTVDFHTDNGVIPAVKGISLTLYPGEVLALVGESGSGKSVTSMAVLRLLPGTAKVGGTIRFAGKDLATLSEAKMNGVRGKDIAMVFQEPMTALNPTMRIGDQITEVLLNHDICPKDRAWERAVELLGRVGIPEPERRAKGYPHELSGGQRQRVVIAIALACNPRIIIADEPTTALDVTVQAEILDLIRGLAAESNTAFLLVTHNMGVVADVADRVAVMFRGNLVEEGPAERVLLAPEADYSRRLLDAVPKLPEAAWSEIAGIEEGVPGQVLQLDGALSITESAPIDGAVSVSDAEFARAHGTDSALELIDATVQYTRKGSTFTALDAVSLTIARGEIVGLVGESGSGKSTLGRAALGLAPLAGGTVNIFGQPVRDRALLNRRERQARARVGVIFQDPGSSLDPRMTIADCIAEPLVVHGWQGKRASSALRRKRVAELLDAVELPRDFADRYPHELSGGQRQRVGLARSIALEPGLIIADEPTSALDVSVQASVLAVLRELQERYGFACLFISHDLAVVHDIAHRVAVMYRGGIVEEGLSSDVLVRPQHEYSKRLLASAPSPDPVEQARRRAARAVLAESVA